MDITFWNQDGGSGADMMPGTTAPDNNTYVELTDAMHRVRFTTLLRTRGFFDGCGAQETNEVAAWTWKLAQLKLQGTDHDAPFDPSLELSPLTPLTLSLPWNQFGSWGTAKLTGQTIDDAWKAITTYLKSGRFFLTHPNPLGLLNHIANYAVRDNIQVGIAVDADRKKPITGTLYFHATHGPRVLIPTAPDANGQTQMRDWVDDAKVFVGQAEGTLERVRHWATLLVEDARDLESITVVLNAVWHVGMLSQCRDASGPSNKTASPTPFATHGPLATFAAQAITQVVLPSGPGGAFGWDWSCAKLPDAKRFAEEQTLKLPHYKALAADYKIAPAANLNLLNEICYYELEVLHEIAADSDSQNIVAPQLLSAISWMGQSMCGDPPDTAGGLGVLLSLLPYKLPAGVPTPHGLLVLASEALHVHLTLDAALGASSSAAREDRAKKAMANLLGLDGETLSKFLHAEDRSYLDDHSGWSYNDRSGWAYLSAILGYTVSSTGVKKETATIIRFTEIGEARAKRAQGIGATSKLPDPLNTQFADKIAWLRAVAFLASGLTVLSDAYTGTLRFDASGAWDPTFEKLLKDSESLFGTLARDFAKTMLQLDKRYALLTPTAKVSLSTFEKSWMCARGGPLLGVVAGIWTFKAAYHENDRLLMTSGVFSSLGYGLRFLFGRVNPLLFVGGVEIALPLLLIGAAIEIAVAIRDNSPTEKMKQQMMAMLKLVCSDDRPFPPKYSLWTWYSRRFSSYTPWRSVDSPAFESAIKALMATIPNCTDNTPWVAFLPWDADDHDFLKDRLLAIGFNDEEADRLTHQWAAWLQQASRLGGKPNSLQAPFYPPEWPPFESAL